jgi:hypothetical protein
MLRFPRRREPDPRVARLIAELAAVQAKLAELEAKAGATDERVGEVGAALTSQLHELSGELESSHRGVDERLAALDALTAGRLAAVERSQEERLAAFRAELEELASGARTGAADGARIDELLERQARIANEVARHEIAFQQELAALADRLLRQRPGR